MNRVVAATLVLGLILGCAGPIQSMPVPSGARTAEGFEEVLETWMGEKATELVRQWGAPDSTFKLADGSTVWSYVSLAQYTTPVTATTKYDESSATYVTSYSGGEMQTDICRVEFEVDGLDTITRWRYEGNDCLAVASPKEYQCLSRGWASKVAEVEAPVDEDPSVKLSDGTRWRISSDSRQYVAELRSGQRVGVCLKSGLGEYLFTFPQRKIIKVSRD